MAGQIRKGFFFYFGLFVLLLVAIFLVCVVVMIFNPGKSVIWLQYFTDSKTYYIDKTTDTDSEINWADVTDLRIECSYANVIIERDNNSKFSKNGLYICNNAKGFTAASSAVPFQYSVEFDNSELVVTVKEPSGFLYFSKSLNIILHSSSIAVNQINFNNVNLIVNTEDGDVCLGSSYNYDDSTTPLQLASVDVETGSGDIKVTDNFNTSSLQSLKFKTGSGDMKSFQKVSYGTKEGTGLNVGCDASFTTEKGLISYDILKVAGKIQFTCKKGNVVSDCLYAGDGISFVSSSQGNYVFNDVYANLEFVSSVDSINSPNITIKNIFGNFTLATSAERGGSPKIKIDKISGLLFVNSNMGNLFVGEASGAVEVSSDGGLSADIAISEENLNPISIDLNSGELKLSFLGVVSNNVDVKTESGNVTVNVTNDAKFAASMFKNDGTNELLPKSNIRVNIGDTVLQDTNPQLVIGNGGNINIFTNAHVAFNLIEK